ESRHSPGTAYFAASRYQVDDREPFVFRTRDFGKTWTKIVAGIAPGHFARSVREDLVKKDLLYLGTEHGVYVSFDAGDHWQSLQLNLPDTPIRDLVVKDADVVLGTHGRGFWILDDIEPLRDLSPAVYTKALTVFEPDEPAIRGIGNAMIRYFLAEKAEKLTIEILDAAGSVVVTFEGSDEVKKVEPNFWSTPGSTTPTQVAGLNQFGWNLRYKGATKFEGMITWSAEPEHGPIAPPGRYQARVTAGGVSESVGFEVVMDPRLKGVTQADLEEQFRLASQINEKTSAANDAVVEIRNLRQELENRLEGTSNGKLQQQGRDLVERISEIERELYQVKNQSGQDP
ncbi:MAG: glycosyl hydrolase, partial [Vicinamibacteria bacterium]